MTSTIGTYAVETGKRMREVREARGMTLDDVELASGGLFKATALGAYERGQRGMAIEILAGYARWLGVDIRLLLPPEEGSDAWRLSVVADAADRALKSVASVISSLTPEEAGDLLVSELTGRAAS